MGPASGVHPRARQSLRSNLTRKGPSHTAARYEAGTCDAPPVSPRVTLASAQYRTVSTCAARICRRNMEEQLSGACTVEIAAFNEFTAVLAAPESTSEFDHVLFDTRRPGTRCGYSHSRALGVATSPSIHLAQAA